MIPLMRHSATVMGAYLEYRPGKVQVTKEWWENDGIVSVRSAIAPHEGSTDRNQIYTGQLETGIWNYLGLINNVDHIEVVCHKDKLLKNTLENTFRHMALFLYSLE